MKVVSRALGAAGLAMMLAGIVLTSAAPVHAGATEASPPGRVVVVTTNLQEAWQTEDMRDHWEMENYVERLMNQLPFFPDMLLLQEVKLSSARYVKELLTAATGDTYGWGVKPPRRPWSQNPRVRTETDSAILFNTTTMRKLDDGGYISLTYQRAHAVDRVDRVEKTQHARVSLAERDGDMTVAGASVHLQYGHLVDRHVDRYQVEWTDKLARVMADRYPDAVRNIGGDFNKDRCAEKTGARTCRKSLFWRNLTESPWNYVDVLYEVFLDGQDGVGLGGVDFIFSTGDPLNGGSDTSYNKNDPDQFYSDHRFFWGVLGTG